MPPPRLWPRTEFTDHPGLGRRAVEAYVGAPPSGKPKVWCTKCLENVQREQHRRGLPSGDALWYDTVLCEELRGCGWFPYRPATGLHHLINCPAAGQSEETRKRAEQELRGRNQRRTMLHKKTVPAGSNNTSTFSSQSWRNKRYQSRQDEARTAPLPDAMPTLEDHVSVTFAQEPEVNIRADATDPQLGDPSTAHGPDAYEALLADTLHLRLPAEPPPNDSFLATTDAGGDLAGDPFLSEFLDWAPFSLAEAAPVPWSGAGMGAPDGALPGDAYMPQEPSQSPHAAPYCPFPAGGGLADHGNVFPHPADPAPMGLWPGEGNAYWRGDHIGAPSPTQSPPPWQTPNPDEVLLCLLLERYHLRNSLLALPYYPGAPWNYGAPGPAIPQGSPLG
ncbi:hypothetical protein PsYK624_103280 [Phanerochaete sordida]|uniref:Uncharacterized protein n=1 Tax=Phanerochaete sordida TaxID=48140 RepID=A0A9P3GFW5_9APHY|nr:hypothetical protein PsYK624_103280 [Phanerochaete sordida]